MHKEAVEIRSQSIEEEEDGFIEEDISVDWASPPIYDTYPDEEVSSTHQVLVEIPKREVFDLEVDFLGVDAILSKTFNQSCDEIYGVETTFLSKSERVFVNTLGILMVCGKCKAWKKHRKSTRQGDVWGFQHNHRNLLMMRAIIYITGCDIVVILRRGKWNELMRLP